jgi:hypothetical protein
LPSRSIKLSKVKDENIEKPKINTVTIGILSITWYNLYIFCKNKTLFNINCLIFNFPRDFSTGWMDFKARKYQSFRLFLFYNSAFYVLPIAILLLLSPGTPQTWHLLNISKKKSLLTSILLKSKFHWNELVQCRLRLLSKS